METEGPDKCQERKERGKSEKIGCHHFENYKKIKQEMRDHCERRKAVQAKPPSKIKGKQISHENDAKIRQ